MIKLWTIGREREKAHATKFVRRPEEQAILFPVIDAVHDLKEGTGSATQFMEVTRSAMTEGGYGVWTNASDWISKVVNEIPSVALLWDELARHPDWKVRWRVACCLFYFGISEDHSNRLFALLRGDKSKKVREYAVSRYENRPNPKNIEKIFDASDFDNRVSRGEVRI